MAVAITTANIHSFFIVAPLLRYRRIIQRPGNFNPRPSGARRAAQGTHLKWYHVVVSEGLFSFPEKPKDQASAHPLEYLPLAARMAPRILDEFVGQEALLGKGKMLRRLIESDRVASLL